MSTFSTHDPFFSHTYFVRGSFLFIKDLEVNNRQKYHCGGYHNTNQENLEHLHLCQIPCVDYVCSNTQDTDVDLVVTLYNNLSYEKLGKYRSGFC